VQREPDIYPNIKTSLLNLTGTTEQMM